MKLTLDEWSELWLRHCVAMGMHTGLVLTMLDVFRRSLAASDLPPLPRIVCQNDRYQIVELATDAGRKTTAIFCRRCCSTSFNPNDVQQLFCGHCNQFHS